jgi:hypothetical protein
MGCARSGTEEVTVNGNTSRMEYHNDFFNCKNVDQKKIEAEVGEEARKLDRWKHISDLCAPRPKQRCRDCRRMLMEGMQYVSVQLRHATERGEGKAESDR